MQVLTSTYIIELIKSFEKISLKPYLCPAGFVTIGYGHKMKNVHTGKAISKEEADHIFLQDLQIAENSVLRNIKVPLKQNQFDALSSFTFNVGGGSLQRSTLRQKINRETFEEASEEFERWVYCGSLKIRGLMVRRKLEAELFGGYLTEQTIQKRRAQITDAKLKA
jgi:lysozyme